MGPYAAQGWMEEALKPGCTNKQDPWPKQRVDWSGNWALSGVDSLGPYRHTSFMPLVPMDSMITETTATPCRWNRAMGHVREVLFGHLWMEITGPTKVTNTTTGARGAHCAQHNNGERKQQGMVCGWVPCTLAALYVAHEPHGPSQEQCPR